MGFFFWFPKGRKNTSKISKNGGLAHIKYNIASPIIL
jgi:hypothetical protein